MDHFKFCSMLMPLRQADDLSPGLCMEIEAKMVCMTQDVIVVIVSSSRVGNIGTPAQPRLAPTTPRSATNNPGSIQSEPAFSKTRGRKLSGEIFGASDLPQFSIPFE